MAARLPFKIKLGRKFSFGAALAMVAAGMLIGVISEGAYQRQQLRDLDIQAATLAESVAAPVMFNDNNAAQENAHALAANPAMDAVAIYGQNGALLASYLRPQSPPLPRQAPMPAAAAYRGAFLEAAAPVRRNGQLYGLVYVRKSADGLLVRLGRYTPIGLLVIMAALVLGAVSRANAELREANARLREEMVQRKQAEEALLQSRKMEAIGQLTGGVAHDFNNLLMVVSGGLRLLDRHADPARRQKTVDAMHQAVERGAGLTRQLLAFARRQPLQLKTIDVERQINGMRELLERSLRADILLDMSFPEPLPPIKTDPGQFELAILNLSVNARDAMPKGGVLTICARHASDSGHVEIIVRDTGTGMTPEVAERVFEPYFTTKQLGQGTGLGLSQVYGFVQQNDGAVRIETAINQGTAVVLSLPVSDEPLADTPPPVTDTINPRPADRRAILVVEDDDEVAGTVCSMLEELGHKPNRARSAAEALDVLSRNGPFDLVFSDIIMPGGKSGVELANELETLAPGLPVLLTTGYSGGVDVAVRRPLLCKPYQIEELRDAISALPAG
jgi:signal transduction histidine kinase